jgi:hypothetical protein
MAVNQDTYLDTMAFAYAGMVANGETSNRPTRTCEDVGGIPFGVPIYRGTDDHGCTRTPNAFLLGISIADETLGLLPGQTADRYQQYDNVAFMTQGVIWVTAGEAVTDGAGAYDTGTSIVGTSTDNDALTGWVFDTTGANASLVKLAKR